MPRDLTNVPITIVNTPWADFEPQLGIIALDFLDKPYICICGQNNSGKSTVLKGVSNAYHDRNSFYLGVQRFVQDVQLDAGRHAFTGTARSSHVGHFGAYNTDGAHYSLEILLTEWDNDRRALALQTCSEILEERFTIELTDANNNMSPYVLKVNGENIRFASTGARLILRMVLEIFNPQFQIMLIDEPELGLSPLLQKRIFDLLADPEKRQRLIPHIQNVVVASHSHIFLDKADVEANYVVRKNGRQTTIRPVQSVQELNQLQINLLGNELDTYLLPAAIIVVEGKTDVAFIQRIVSLKYSNRNVIVVSSEDGLIKRLRTFNQMIGGTQQTPYHSRTFVVLDSIHHGITHEAITRAGVARENIIEWAANGIEFVYPINIMREIFRCSEEQIRNMNIAGDEISINGTTLRKNELADRVTSQIRHDTTFPEEFVRKFFAPLDAILL